jgi:hypothetical protein
MDSEDIDNSTADRSTYDPLDPTLEPTFDEFDLFHVVLSADESDDPQSRC